MKRVLAIAVLLVGLPAVAGAQRLPADVCTTLRAERARYAVPTSAELAAILNAAAWARRADGWGLNAKPAGNSCPSPGGVAVACDILERRSDTLMWDVFVDAGGASTLTCGDSIGPADPSRVWVAPLEPATPSPTPEPTPTPTPIDLAPLIARLDALQAGLNRVDDHLAEQLGAFDTISSRLDQFAPQIDQARAESYNAAVRALELQASVAAMAKSLEEHRTQVKAEYEKAKSFFQQWIVEKVLPIVAGLVAGIKLS